MGSKGSQTTTTNTNQNQTYTANPAISGAATQAITGAETAAASPFSMPVAPVAGFNPFQQQAFGQIQGLQGTTQPYFNTASNLMTQSAAPVTAADVNQYYNPMVDSVTAQLQNIFGQQNRQATTGAVQAAGGVGADRVGVTQGNLANQQTLGAGQTYAGLYQQALAQAQQQKQMAANAGYGEAALGQGALNAGLTETGALAGAGSQQQQLTQAQQNAQYQNILAQIAYQFQTPQYLAGIAGGLAPALGGTTLGVGTSATTQPPPNILNSIIGGGLGGIGLAGSLGLFGGDTGGGVNPQVAGYTGTVGGAGNQIVPTVKRGGRIGMADGGDADQTAPEIPGIARPNTGGLSPIPNVRLPMGGGEFHNNLNLTPPQVQNKSGSGSNAIGDIAALAKIGMMFANRGGYVEADGGAVMPEHALTGFDAGGDVTFDDSPIDTPDVPLPRPNPLGGLTPSMREKFPEIRTAAAERGVNFDIGEGYRPQQRQNILYSQGRDGNPGSIVTNTRNSNHTSGNAIDVLPTGGTTDKQVGDTLTDLTMHDPRFANMRSGATFSKLYDPRHIELLGNKEARTPGLPGINPDVADIPSKSTPISQTGLGGVQPISNVGNYPVPFPHAAEDSLGHRMANSPWMNLALAGASMAASRSPFVGVALGEGMQAGLQGFQTQRKQNISEEEVNQRAMSLAQQAQFHLDSYNKLTAAQQLEANKPFKIGEDPNTGLDVYGIRGPRGQMIPIDPTTGQPRDPSTAQAAQPEKESKPTEAPPLGVEEFRPNLNPTKYTGPQRLKGPFAQQEAGNIRNIDAAMNKERNALDVQHDQINRLKMDYATVMKDNDQDGFFTRLMQTPGANPEMRVEAMKKANLVATSAKKPPPFNPDKVAAMEEAIKIQKTMGMSFAATISPRDAMQMQLASISAQPGFTQSPQGMMRLIGLYDGLTNHNEARHDFWGRWRQANPTTSVGWEEDFRKKNPVDTYTTRALIENMPNQKAKGALPDAIKFLRENNTPENVAKFNKIYNNTASYFLTGKLDPYSLLK